MWTDRTIYCYTVQRLEQGVLFVPDFNEEKSIPAIILNHEGRICTLEEARENMERRMDRFEAKLDKLYYVGWLIVLGMIGSLISPHLHF